MYNTVPISTSHILIVKSAEPLTKSPFLSSSNAHTSFKCPVRVTFTVPSFKFLIFIVLSPDALAKSPF